MTPEGPSSDWPAANGERRKQRHLDGTNRAAERRRCPVERRRCHEAEIGPRHREDAGTPEWALRVELAAFESLPVDRRRALADGTHGGVVASPICHSTCNDVLNEKWMVKHDDLDRGVHLTPSQRERIGW